MSDYNGPEMITYRVSCAGAEGPATALDGEEGLED